MKLPNPECAVIAPEKPVQYLLNTEHKRGGHKARMLIDFGYDVALWQQLQTDIQQFHLPADVEIVRQTSYGMRYEISAPLLTPTFGKIASTISSCGNVSKDKSCY